MVITPDFFDRPADRVARDLLGMYLCVKDPGGTVQRLLINEVEAYMGSHDLASHSSKGRTHRTETMYGKPGTVYVYLIYGMYHMFNIVTGKKDYPAAVLIRGAGAYTGPGKLTKALGIHARHNNSMLGRAIGIWIERAGTSGKIRRNIIATPRIGVQYAGVWADKKLRFCYTDTMGNIQAQGPQDKKRRIREVDHMTRPPRMEGKVKEAMMQPIRKKKKQVG